MADIRLISVGAETTMRYSTFPGIEEEWNCDLAFIEDQKVGVS